MSIEQIEQIISMIGDNPSREGLIDTPKRVINSWTEIYSGYGKNPKDILTTFSADGYDEIILLKDIEMYSMCEHHMLPFYGKAHVAYLPNPKGKIVGISKLARLVEIYARRLQIQERIGKQITEDIMTFIGAQGAVCIIEATHMCMRMRGVAKQNSVMITSSLRGVFREKPALKQEILQLLS